MDINTFLLFSILVVLVYGFMGGVAATYLAGFGVLYYLLSCFAGFFEGLKRGFSGKSKN